MRDKLRAAAQAGLDAMESSRVFVTSREQIKQPEGADWYDNIINDLEAALAEQTVKESLTVQRPWVGLTDDEIWQEWSSPKDSAIDFARTIEAKLREKNG
jgi:hypothetical protein